MFFLQQLTNQTISLSWFSNEEGRDDLSNAHAKGKVPVRSEGWDKGDRVEECNIKEGEQKRRKEKAKEEMEKLCTGLTWADYSL